MTRQATRVAILILGTADWNQQIATNQHYMTRELAAIDGARVWFTESLGLRKPELRVRDMRRVAHRVFGKSRGGSTGERRPVPDNVHIISPLVAPYHGISTATINRLLLSRSVREWLRSPGEKVLWSYSPVTYGLEKYADVSYYHCVDLLDTIPGIDAGVIRRNEARLASHRHVRAIASSDVVKKHLESRGFIDPVLWENVADVSRFGTPAEPDVAAGEARIIFAGNLAPNKVNFELLTQLAERGLHVSLAGPLAEGGGDVANQMDRLLASGCRYLGSLSIDELSDALAASSIGLIPYLQNDYTRGVSPLKTFEYLASGLQVVATPIPGVHASERDVVVVEPARFVDTVMRLASANRTLADVQRRRQIAEQHSWHQRGADARALVRGDLERRRNTTRVAVVAHADVWGGAERYLCELYSRLGDTVQTELVGAIPNWPPRAC
ncbi:glycosyltransferase [Microbacterium imperiale]|uniref:glycosyltransferase n=1 Tax=Microbacterium imperiale TaxID=33884 RepID=UPI0022F2503D|nr:glycosyltransferase [Microbacterium imperiale]